jgi:hypothetical protein
MVKYALRLAIALFMIGATPALAGGLNGGAWTPSQCGTEPTAPQMDLHSADAYAQSIKWVQLYQDKIKTYSDCVIKEANSDSRAINDWVNAEQARVKEAFDRYNTDSKAAAAKFSKGK